MPTACSELRCVVAEARLPGDGVDVRSQASGMPWAPPPRSSGRARAAPPCSELSLLSCSTAPWPTLFCEILECPGPIHLFLWLHLLPSPVLVGSFAVGPSDSFRVRKLHPVSKWKQVFVWAFHHNVYMMDKFGWPDLSFISEALSSPWEIS